MYIITPHARNSIEILTEEEIASLAYREILPSSRPAVILEGYSVAELDLSEMDHLKFCKKYRFFHDQLTGVWEAFVEVNLLPEEYYFVQTRDLAEEKTWFFRPEILEIIGFPLRREVMEAIRKINRGILAHQLGSRKPELN